MRGSLARAAGHLGIRGEAEALAAGADQLRELEADRREEREVRGEAALRRAVAAHLALERVRPLLVPMLAHFAVSALFLQHVHEVLAVDDLRMVVDREHPRHDA